jgi:hypothetical protein
MGLVYKVCHWDDNSSNIKVIIIVFLDIHFYVLFNLKHNVSENGFCLRLQVRSTELAPIDRASLYFRTWATKQNIQTKQRIKHLRELKKH